MNYKWIVLSALSLATLCSCTRVTQKPSQQHSAFAARIESVLPSDWALEESGQETVITRKQPITRYPCVAMDVGLFRQPDGLRQFVKTNGISDSYQIRLRRAAAMDTADYQRLKAINNQIVVTKSTVMPSRKFLEDDAMRSFDSRYRELPEYYDNSSSIYFETNLGPYECIYPGAVGRECEAIRQKLDSLFNRYSSDNHPRGLSFGID
jgi:hypothetical protein